MRSQLPLLLLLVLLPLVAAQLDRNCRSNILERGACCPAICGTCGGSECGANSSRFRTTCCPNAILRSSRVCNSVAPPCKLAGASASSSVPNPTCRGGLITRGACCPRACLTCGGAGCGIRGRALRSNCCTNSILGSNRFCATTGAPCRLAAGTNPTPRPSTNPTPRPSTNPTSNPVSTLTGTWDLAPVSSGELVRRHEACAIMVRGLLVLLGGRGANKRVSIYNPVTRAWTRRDGPGPNIEIHHFQCVATPDGRIWIPTSWTGGFPMEENNDKIYIYNVVRDEWSTRRGLPEPRRRGGAAAVLRNGNIFVVGGNRGGHGMHATTLTYMDSYNIATNTWTTNLPSLPAGQGRDHVGAALVGGRMCIAGGRDGGVRSFPTAGLTTSYCYNFSTRTWIRVADFPQRRAGAMTGTTCDGRMMIAGGEGDGVAYARVDLFDGTRWTRGPDLVDSRHGSGLGISNCSCGVIFIPSGSGNQGGSPELLTTERYIPRGANPRCSRF